ncbi:MAG: RDD family protein, partial [Bradyrhizobiaceae bacterium]|nr:RDD family protein [Bradyrhizobiaceae bacterium]
MTAQNPSADTPMAAHERTSQFFEGGRRRKREIVTPEGVPVNVEIPDYGERLIAFIIDFVIWTLLTLAIYIPVLSMIGRAGGYLIALSIALFLGFLIRNLYFIYFELAWQGATPGKRIIGLRVIERNGGPLTAAAVIARNLTREVEIFIPLGILLNVQSVEWQNLLLVGWTLFFLALPALNRDRMRGGDLIAGTLVIALPRRA